MVCEYMQHEHRGTCRTSVARQTHTPRATGTRDSDNSGQRAQCHTRPSWTRYNSGAGRDGAQLCLFARAAVLGCAAPADAAHRLALHVAQIIAAHVPAAGAVELSRDTLAGAAGSVTAGLGPHTKVADLLVCRAAIPVGRPKAGRAVCVACTGAKRHGEGTARILGTAESKRVAAVHRAAAMVVIAVGEGDGPCPAAGVPADVLADDAT